MIQPLFFLFGMVFMGWLSSYTLAVVAILLWGMLLMASNLYIFADPRKKAAQSSIEGHLYVFAQSHFVDKARMLLKQSSLKVQEHALPSGMTTLWRGMNAPTLVYKGRSVIGDSSDIATFLAGLEPETFGWLRPAEHAERIDKLEQLADKIAIKARQFAYGHLFNEKDDTTMRDLMFDQTPPMVKMMMPVLYPFCRAFVRFGLALNDKSIASAETRLREIIDDLEKEFGDRLKAGKPLLGEHRTLADIAIVSALGPVVFPPKYGTGLADKMSPSAFPKVCTDFFDANKKTEIGRYVLRMYAECK